VNNIDKKIIELFIKFGEVQNNIGLDTKFIELGLESIAFVSIIVEVEDNYEIEFDDENMIAHNYQTVGDFIKYVKDKIANNKFI